MTKKIASSAVPALRLTAQDESEMRQLSEQLDQEILSQYEEFLFQNRRSVDASKWKHARSDGDIHAYEERPVKPHCGRASPFTALHPTKHRPRPQERLVEQSAFPRMLVTGTVPGTLDDIMYGMSFHDTPSVQAHWTALRSAMEESAVVAKLDGPTIDDPYRFLGAIWFLRTFPLNILQCRDVLSVHFSRTTRLSNGERVGIVGGHSFEHDDLPELNEIKTVRATASVLNIYRQLDDNRVEIFMIHYLDTKASLPRHMQVQLLLGYTMPLAASLDNVGFRRKLARLVAGRRQDDSDSTSSETIEPQSSGTNEYCEVCTKKIGSLFTCPSTSCELCYQRICLRCRVSHDLVVRASGGRMSLKAHDFCAHCSLQARSMSTLKVAQDEVHSGLGSSPPLKPRKRVLTTLVSVDSLKSFH